jgi:hypothetical protein
MQFALGRLHIAKIWRTIYWFCFFKLDEEELMMHLINTGTQVAGNDGAKNNVQEDADDRSQYLALEQNEQEDIVQVYIFCY